MKYVKNRLIFLNMVYTKIKHKDIVIEKRFVVMLVKRETIPMMVIFKNKNLCVRTVLIYKHTYISLKI